MISQFYSFWVYSTIIYYGYTCRICRIWSNSNWKIFRKNIWFREVILFKCMLFRYKGCGICKSCAMYVNWHMMYINTFTVFSVEHECIQQKQCIFLKKNHLKILLIFIFQINSSVLIPNYLWLKLIWYQLYQRTVHQFSEMFVSPVLW